MQNRTITIAANDPLPVFGALIVCTAILAEDGGDGTPDTGNVTFLFDDDNEQIVDAVGGIATASFRFLSFGSHTVDASYAGSDNYAASTAVQLSIFVAKASSTAAITASNEEPVIGESVTYIVTLTANGHDGGSGIPDSGNVTFTFDGDADNNQVIVVQDNSAITSFQWATPGAHTLDIKYSGNANFKPSYGKMLIVVSG